MAFLTVSSEDYFKTKYGPTEPIKGFTTLPKMAGYVTVTV
jgi:hypothetical protein